MTSWKITTVFVTDKPLDHGNWSFVDFDTEDEAMMWWLAPDVRSVYKKILTLTDHDGNVVDERVVS
jgi:hypothetical protein